MTILLVDLYNMIHRARHSFIKGENAVIFNFFRSLKSEIERHTPDKVYIVSEGVPFRRLQINPEYKGTRDRTRDDNFSRQKRKIIELIKHLPVTFARHEQLECDDVIAHLASNVYKDQKVIILSTDTDFIQLLENENTKLWNPIKKKFIDRWPVDYLVYKSLKGDSSDNVAGVKGVGDKTARKLAGNAEMLKQFFDRKPEARSQFESAIKQIRFIDIEPNDRVLQLEVCNSDLDYLRSAFTDLNFKSIIGKSWSKWQNTMETLNESRAEAKLI